MLKDTTSRGLWPPQMQSSRVGEAQAQAPEVEDKIVKTFTKFEVFEYKIVKTFSIFFFSLFASC